MSSDTQSIDELSALRAEIDRIDHRLLRSLAERLAVVERIAACKRAAAMPIRDLQRERQVLHDRRQRAQELALPEMVVDSIFRLLLLASRHVQSALRVEMPPELSAQEIAIVGGRGGMGSRLAAMFTQLGHNVVVVDTDTAISASEAARRADVVLVSVPIRVTEEVVRQLGPLMRREALLMDVTSLKEAPLRAMLEATPAAVVGTHPMFGPTVHTLAGQRIVLCRGRGDGWYDWVTRTFHAAGLLITEASAAEHDAMMAVVQVLTHLQKQVLGLTLQRHGIPFERSLVFTSPSYLLETTITARHFAQSAELYGAIEMLNPCTQPLLATYRQAVEQLTEIVQSGDQRQFAAIFSEVRSFFGKFCEQAEQRSTFLIDRLVELTAGEEEAPVSESPTEDPRFFVPPIGIR